MLYESAAITLLSSVRLFMWALRMLSWNTTAHTNECALLNNVLNFFFVSMLM